MFKYSLGIDVSKEHLQVCLMSMDNDQTTKVIRNRRLANRSGGFKELHLMITQHLKNAQVPLQVVVEATGVYYEGCCFFLLEKGYSIAVVLPSQAKSYLHASGHKSKNDKIDAVGLAQMGAEKKLRPWQPHGDFFYKLRLYTRQYETIVGMITAFENQLHAMEHSGRPIDTIMDNQKQVIAVMKKTATNLKEEIQRHLGSDADIWRKVQGLTKIKGLGVLTIATILAETNGFELFRNARQLVSFAGYDVVENQSGNHVGKTRISKMGNSHIRRILHFAALTAVKYRVEPFLSLFERTLARHQRKMKSYVAIQKKLLVLIYSLWKKDEVFDAKHGQKTAAIDEEGGAPSRVNLEEVEQPSASEADQTTPPNNKALETKIPAPIKKSSPLRATQGVQPTTNRRLHPLE